MHPLSEPGPLAASAPAAQQRVIAIEALGAADIAAADALVRECGWNQVAEDWALFLRCGAAFKVPSADGGLAATAAILPYAPGFGWISMVLVSQAQRRQGLATALLEHCIAALGERALVPVLDATPAGREVYRQLGFHDGWAISRWRRSGAAATAAPEPPPGVRVRPPAEADLAWIAARDAEVFGADRSSLLRSLAERSASFACVAERQGQPCGYLLGRNGRTATHIGPVVADDAAAAQALVGDALQRIPGPVLIDALDRHAGIAETLRHAGFAVERGYTRMIRGRDTAFGDARRTIAIAGPELG